MRPLDSRRFFFERMTGAATTRFCVKTAAAEAGTSLEMSARSSAPVFLRPHAVAAKRNPLGSADSGGGWVISRRLPRSEEHTSELQSHHDLVCRLLLEKKKKKQRDTIIIKQTAIVLIRTLRRVVINR